MSAYPSRAVNPAVSLLSWGLVGYGLGRLWPTPFLPAPARAFVAKPILFAGVMLVAWSMFEFWRRGASVDHGTPSSTLVVSGPFRFSRNPIYVGFVLMMAGLSLNFENVWSLLLIVPTVFGIRRFTILREEAHLEQTFGDRYIRYKASVRRWF